VLATEYLLDLRPPHPPCFEATLFKKCGLRHWSICSPYSPTMPCADAPLSINLSTSPRFIPVVIHLRRKQALWERHGDLGRSHSVRTSLPAKRSVHLPSGQHGLSLDAHEGMYNVKRIYCLLTGRTVRVQVFPSERYCLPPETTMDPRQSAQQHYSAVGLPHGYPDRPLRRA
jgi:hypothetical protein